MAVAHYTLTMTGSAQRLNTALDSSYQGPHANQDQPVRAITLQPHATAAGVIYVGGANATVTNTNYAFRLEIPVTSIPPAPFVLELSGSKIWPSDFYVLGTSGDELQVGLIY